MKKLLFIALLSLSTIGIDGQTEDVDSLVNRLNSLEMTMEEQMELLYKICDAYVVFDIEKASEYAKQGLITAEKEKNKLMASKFTGVFGRIYATKSDNETALDHWEKALDYAIVAKDMEQEASVYQGIGVLYGRQAKYVPALDYFLKAFSIYENIGDKRKCIVLLSNIATIHIALFNNERAMYYLERAKIIAEEIDYTEGLMQIYYGLGSIYFDFGNITKEPENYELALEYALKAYPISIDLNELSMQGVLTEMLSKIYLRYHKDYEMAIKYANEYLHIVEKLGDPRYIAAAWATISSVHLMNENYKESEDAALMALKIDTTNINTHSDLMFYLTSVNINLCEKEKASQYFNKFASLLTTQIFQIERETLADMEFKYETEKKEMRIATLEKERQLYVWLIVTSALLLVTLAITLLLTVRNARKQRQLVVAEAIQEGELNERTRIAQDLHDRLGGSLTAVKIGLVNVETLQVINDKIDSCIKELREITNNIMPRSLQIFGMKGALEDFCSDISNLHFHFFGEAGRIRQNQEYTVYCCARELVNNALKHSGAANVNLQLVQSKKYVTLTVQDDGCGFDEKSVKMGNGLTNIRNRVASYKGRIDFASKPGKGTETVIELLVIS